MEEGCPSGQTERFHCLIHGKFNQEDGNVPALLGEGNPTGVFVKICDWWI